MAVDFNAIMEEAMKSEAGKKAWDNKDPDITYAGNMITLPGEPGPMPTEKAIEALKRKLQDENTMLDVTEILDAHPQDALVAFNAAMKEKYGWASPTPTMSFFGPIPPDLVTVKTGYEDHENVQVPSGRFTLPGVENAIVVHTHNTKRGPVLAIHGTVRKREAAVVKELAILARQILKERSIYKGKAIRLHVTEEGALDMDTAPSFLNTKTINPDELVLNPDELLQVRAGLWAPIQNTDACLQHKIPLNRGVLLEGPYGTGKTMTAHVTSKICEQNGWTYILLDDVRALKDALLFAQRYQPAVIFAEDVDRIAAKRDQAGNDLLNTIDGVLTKNSQVITVMSTNFVEKLDPAMLRPGRLDSVISIRAPEKEAAERLVRIYARDLLDSKESIDDVGVQLAGNIPATIREVVERSKLTMLMDSRKKLVASDLMAAALGMTRHLELLNSKPDPVSTEHKFGALMIELLGPSMKANAGEAVANIGMQVEEIHDHLI